MGVIVWRKDPDEVLDFKLDWTGAFTGSETIATSEWIIPTGITKNSEAIANDNTVAVLWLSGGTDGTTYTLTNRITTTGGRTMDQTVLVVVGNN